jgi:hypothetical protein
MRRQRAEKQSAPDDVLNTEKSRRLMAKKVSAWRKKRDQTQLNGRIHRIEGYRHCCEAYSGALAPFTLISIGSFVAVGTDTGT